MVIQKDVSFAYRRTLSRPMAELLADPFSELTRKRQSALLIAATLTLLLSAGLIKVTDATVANAKVELLIPEIAKWLAFAITAYLLLGYLLGVWADLAIAKAKRWSPLAKIRDVAAEMKSDQENRLQAGKARSEQLDRLNAQELSIKADINSRLDSIRTKQRAINNAISSTNIDSASSDELAENTKLAKEATELVRAETDTMVEMHDRVWPIIVARKEVTQNWLLEPTVSMWSERTNIVETVGTFANLTRLRLFFEVIFPAVYGSFALVWTILHR